MYDMAGAAFPHYLVEEVELCLLSPVNRATGDRPAGGKTEPGEKLLGVRLPFVVIVTIVYQKEAGMLVNLLELEPFSA
ncbi:hypothetical protein EYF80_023386 [Liparis tanakae]|uniref:Uncharacterized protein n=1 Tax=Liparis tanakae TaxID=230148 RepID=A0A4Z2HKV6_9TELE|nr:hypothetical protein EYF80_023386 [Liparis tanakae]